MRINKNEGIYFAERHEEQAKKVGRLEDIPTESFSEFDEYMSQEQNKEAAKTEPKKKEVKEVKDTNYGAVARQAYKGKPSVRQKVQTAKVKTAEVVGETAAKTVLGAETAAKKTGSAVKTTVETAAKTARGTTRLAGKTVGAAKKTVGKTTKGSVGFFGSLIGAFKDGYNKGVK